MAKSKVILLDWWNSDRDIAESAWVSTKKMETCLECKGVGEVQKAADDVYECLNCSGTGKIEKCSEKFESKWVLINTDKEAKEPAAIKMGALTKLPKKKSLRFAC